MEIFLDLIQKIPRIKQKYFAGVYRNFYFLLAERHVTMIWIWLGCHPWIKDPETWINCQTMEALHISDKIHTGLYWASFVSAIWSVTLNYPNANEVILRDMDKLALTKPQHSTTKRIFIGVYCMVVTLKCFDHRSMTSKPLMPTAPPCKDKKSFILYVDNNYPHI